MLRSTKEEKKNIYIYIYMCVCVCVCMHACVCVCIQTYIYIHTYIYIYIYETWNRNIRHWEREIFSDRESFTRETLRKISLSFTLRKKSWEMGKLPLELFRERP